MASSGGDVEAMILLEPVEVEQTTAAEINDGGESGLPPPGATTTTTEGGQRMLHQEQQHGGSAPAAVSASEEEPEKRKPPLAETKKVEPPPEAAAKDEQEMSTRERLKRHRREMAGRVWVPERWGQEELLKDWVDCAAFDRPLVPAGLLSARRALIADCCTRRPDRTSPATSAAGSSPLRVHNGCS